MVTQEIPTDQVRCPRCGMGNVPGAVFCATCGNRLSGSAQPTYAPAPSPTVGQSLAPASQAVGNAVEWIKRGGDKAGDHIADRRFPGLQATAGILKVVAIVTALWGVLGVIGAVNTFHTEWNFNPLDPAGFDMDFAIGAPIVVGLILWALSGLILVLLDIEAGIRRSQ